ncbi:MULTISPECIES: trans-aconitate 2-methyltransferase [Halostella]|uniref:class I SAM-dependent methyltransferase n=1 Tax=Halostella TaxID=1843185 RepID=UPI001969A6AA|nr:MULTISPECIES: methyltransferase domain-containing protein [Halostella]
MRFERAVLPEFDPGRAFDCVLCYGTLCYVSESERALRNLYDAVAPGGYLVLGYMNRLAARTTGASSEKPRPKPTGTRPTKRRWNAVESGSNSSARGRARSRTGGYATRSARGRGASGK